MLIEHERALKRVCFDLTPPEGALEALGAQRDRWLLYRSMVRTRLRGMVRTGLKRTVESLGDEGFDRFFDRWLAEAPPSTRYIREIIPDFVDFVLPLWEADESVQRLHVDLARWERAKWEVGYLDVSTEPAGEFDFQKVPVVNPALRLLALSHPVHEKLAPGERHPEREVHLCVFRRPDNHHVSTWVLKERTVWFLHEWMRGEANTTDSVRAVAEAHGMTIDAQLVEVIGTTLAELLQAGILLGGRDPQ